MTPAPAKVPALLALGAGVLALHLLALQAGSGRVVSPGTAPAPRLMVRALEGAQPPSSVHAPTAIGPSTLMAAAAGAPTPTGDPARQAAAGAKDPAVSGTLAQEPSAIAAAGTTRAPAPPAHPVAVPPSMRLHYELSGSSRGVPVTGRAELTWQRGLDRYDARLEWIPDGALRPRRSQHSTGWLTAQGLAPERFADRARHEEAVHFDVAGQRIVFSAHLAPVPLLPGAQDRLSVLLQLAAMVAGRPADYPAGRRIALQTATAREAPTWAFEVQGEEQLALPGGPQQTLRLLRPALGAFDPKIEVWLALGLDYAPVRLRLTQPTGDWMEQRWSATDRL